MKNRENKMNVKEQNYDSLSVCYIQGYANTPGEPSQTLIPMGSPYWLISNFEGRFFKEAKSSVVLWSDLDMKGEAHTLLGAR